MSEYARLRNSKRGKPIQIKPDYCCVFGNLCLINRPAIIKIILLGRLIYLNGDQMFCC